MTSIRRDQATNIREDISEAVVSRFRPDAFLSQAHLRCLKCGNALMPVPLSTDSDGNQTIWWMCKSVRDEVKKCDFPATMPTDVFWVKRTPEEKKRNYFPHPRIDLLPFKYRRYYPSIFKTVLAPPPSRCSPDTGNSEANQVDDNPVAGVDDQDKLKANNSTTVKNVLRRKVAAPSASGSTREGSVCSFSSNSHSSASSTFSTLSSRERFSGVDLGDVNESNRSSIQMRVASQRKANKRKRDRRGISLGDALAQELDKLDYSVIRDEDLVKLAEKVMEKLNVSSGKADEHWWHSVLVNEEYHKVVREAFASIDFQEAKRSAAANAAANRGATILSLRNARNGSEILAAVGVGSPNILPHASSYRQSMKERLETIMKQVALRKKEIDERLQKEVLGSARLRGAEMNSKLLTSAENSPKRRRLEHEAQQESDREHEVKAKQLVRGKITQVLNAKRQSDLTRVSSTTTAFNETIQMEVYYDDSVQPGPAFMHPSASAPEFSYPTDIIDEQSDFSLTFAANMYRQDVVYQPHGDQYAADEEVANTGSFRDTAYDAENFDMLLGGDDIFGSF